MHRAVPGLCHVPENRCLLPVVGHHYPHPNGRGARHPQPALPENHLAAPGLLLRRTQGRHHSPYERRRAGDRELHHGFAGDALQEPHPHHQLLRCLALHLMAADALHPHHRAHHGVVHGLGGPQVEGTVDTGPGPVERHDESGGGDPRGPAHHQGLLCRGQDEPPLRQHQHSLPQRHHAGQYPPVVGPPHVGVPRHHHDCHRALVRRCAGA